MKQLHFGTIAHLKGNPFQQRDQLEIIESGALMHDERGSICYAGPSEALDLTQHQPLKIVDHGPAWILPGMVDGHVHYPQVYAVAAPGGVLLDWLSRYIYPAEMKFVDVAYARRAAQRFVHQLIANGTTTALVFGSQFEGATRMLFETADQMGLRMTAGHTFMDRLGPEALLTTPKAAAELARETIAFCRERPLLDYAVTPRFAISCSPELLATCAQILADYPECYLQTHINENEDEIAAVADLFPQAEHYLDVYQRFGLVGPRSVFAHAIHNREAELAMFKERGCSVCNCTASNLFLGSGIFPMADFAARGIPFMLGTDIGAGAHFSIIEELGEAYRVQKLKRFELGADHLLYLGTLAGAVALKRQHQIGNFTTGKQADFIVIDPRRDPFLAERLEHADAHVDKLFSLIQLGGAEHVSETWIAGRQVYPFVDEI